MKRMVMLLLMVAIGMVMVLSACGEKSQEDVVKKLDDKVSKMEGYKTKAKMEMDTGQDKQTYKIDVWHKHKDYYRVALSNQQDKKGSQIILKNKDGVFVLTPELDKQFKFQTDWPDNSSQPYLFQSLVKDVKSDKDATFKSNESDYIFQTKTNYQSNNNLPYQEIHFDKKTYEPTMVKVLDKDKKPLVKVSFSKFDKKPSFKDTDFEVKNNMSAKMSDESVSADEDGDSEQKTKTKSLEVTFPVDLEGSELSEQKEVDTDNGKRVIMTYSGDKKFTLIEESAKQPQTLSEPKEVQGDIVNLGHSIGALSDNTITWNHDGVDFHLASEDLTKDELIQVAESVQGKAVK